MRKIGFIDVDGLDQSMVRSMIKAGYTVYLYTEDCKMAKDMSAEGAIICQTTGSCTKECDAIVKMIRYLDKGKCRLLAPEDVT